MKRVKSIFALLMAVIMVLAMGTTAFAAETNEGSITVDNAVNDKQYTIYRIFDLNSHNDDYSAINYVVSDKWSGFFAEGQSGLTYVNVDNQGYVTWKETADVAAFAAAAKAYAAENSVANDGQKTAANGEVKFENLPLGYYLVASEVDATCSLDTTKPDVTIKEKNSKPTIDKQVEEDSTSKYGKTDDADIGQTVNFKTTLTVVDGYPKNYVVHDTMSAGLKFDANSVKVTVNGEVMTDYTLVTENLTDNCTFEIRFKDNVDSEGVTSSVLKPNDSVVITYSATVTADAVVGGTGNPNSTKLSYTDKNNQSHDTEESKTYTYVWKMDVFKYTQADGAESALKDAKFVLYYKSATDEKMYAVVDENNKVTGWTANAYNSEEAVKASVFTTPENGKFSITGLDADTYYLEEIEAPASRRRGEHHLHADRCKCGHPHHQHRIRPVLSLYGAGGGRRLCAESHVLHRHTA